MNLLNRFANRSERFVHEAVPESSFGPIRDKPTTN